MSFLVAHKYKDNIFFFADTKLTFETNKKFCTEAYNNINNYGVLKFYGITHNAYILFAGNVHYMNKVIEKIEIAKKNNVQEIFLKEIINLIYHFHNKSYESGNEESETDFALLIKDKDESNIYQFKNKIVSVVDNCWLGDKDAFEKYQSMIFELRNDFDLSKIFSTEASIENTIKDNAPTTFKLNGNMSYLSCKLSPDLTSDIDFRKYLFMRRTAFLNLIESGDINSVGKFAFCFVNNKDLGFMHMDYYLSRQKIKFYEKNKNGGILTSFGNVEDGDITIGMVYNAFNSFSIEVPEIKKRIEFKKYNYKEKEIPGLEYMMLPREISNCKYKDQGTLILPVV